MLTVAEASQAIAKAMPAFGAAPLPLEELCGRILRQAITAERDQPPFDRVTMDGIALSFDAWNGGLCTFEIQGTQHAGDPVLTLAEPGNCIEIMTGGVLPAGTDCVIAVERISVNDGVATIEDGYEPSRNQFIHPQGSDYNEGHEVLAPGATISPMDVAVIASCGLDSALVSKQPVVRVISTGNELVAPGQAIETHQVRLSNGPALVAMLTSRGFTDTADEHIVDDPAILETRLSELLETSDVLILSGGVSMGKADFVPQVLKDLGVAVVFHKISQRPGKPMWFGIGPKGQVVFALPGNPVSSLVCCRQYVLPALLQAAGRTVRKTEYAQLAEDVSFGADLTFFMPVQLATTVDGSLSATPVATNTSGDFAALSGTDGYVELVKDQSEFAAGSVVPLHRWDAP